jgi:NodT family efflux transporter outer membrane factor (OMF) lipoprotein
MIPRLIIIGLFSALTACSFAPTYQRPAISQPVKFKESGQWIYAKPDTAALDKGSWWTMYHDPVLNQLEDQVAAANFDLKAAVARYDQACTAVAIAKADYYPSLTGIANITKQKASQNITVQPPMTHFNDFIVGANLNYELDVWGRVRNSVASAKSLASASAADVALMNLSLHTELASDYFALREADASQRILDETVIAYQKSLYLTQQRYHGGASPVLDLDQAQTQLENAKTQAANMHIVRAQYEHAIAVLIGQAPSLFSIKPAKPNKTIARITPNLPSTLLEQRPDIAAAEYAVQSANYQIGVARAAFFPAFNLTTAIGYDSATLPNLLKAPSLAWSLGPTLSSALLNNGSLPEMTQILFDGGNIAALSRQALAQYNETVARYQQTVLSAYKEVEDSLIALHQLDKENHSQTRATAAAKRSLDQAMYRYKGGLTTYLDVVVIQNLTLQSQLAEINIHARRQQASVQLIKALGGGWHMS